MIIMMIYHVMSLWKQLKIVREVSDVKLSFYDSADI